MRRMQAHSQVGPEPGMSGMEHDRNAHRSQMSRYGSRLLSVLVLVLAGLGVPTCYWYEHPGVYYCDETNNCADVPTTVCVTEENRCRCPTAGHLYCYMYSRCTTEAECFPEAGAPCDAGTSTDDGGGVGGGDGGGVGGGGGGGAGGAGGG